MTNSTFKRKPRIEIIDAIRGFALLGILLLHCIEHFDFLHRPEFDPEFFHPINRWLNRNIRLLFSGKSYSIFSLMFGLSFFIQMDRNAGKGIDYRLTFLWRLAILLVIGYIHSAFYIGEVLSMYAILGAPLVLIFNLNKRSLLILAILFLLQLPLIYFLIQVKNNPDFSPFVALGRGGYRQASQIFAEGNIWQVFQFGLVKGHAAKWGWMINNGRLTQLLGLFILGLYVGKTRYFENTKKHIRTTIIILVSAIVVYIIFRRLTLNINEFTEVRIERRLFRNLFNSYANIAFVAIIISCLVLIYDYTKIRFKLMALYGRMSLSSYVMQAAFGVPFFYGFGLAMYKYFNVTFSIAYGIVFYILQLLFSKWWFKRYYYGPLEWVWRSLTKWDFKLKNKLQ